MADNDTAPEAQAADEATPDVTATADQNTDTQAQAANEDVFDRDRALKLIEKLRGEEKRAKELDRRVRDYEQREKEAELAKLSELERLNAQLADREKTLADQRKQAQDRINQYEVQVHSARLGIIDPEAAVKLLDWSTLDYADDGTPTNVEDALNALVTARPYLKAPEQQQRAPSVASTNGATRSSGPGQRIYTSEQLADREFYLKNRDDINLAFREGRIRT